MSLAQPISSYFSVEDYLRLERTAVEKHEFHDGRILAMAGGSPNHSLIIANFIGEVRQRLKGKPCRIYESNLRVHISRTTLYTYPDASILCHPPQSDPIDKEGQTVLNPGVIIEVVSPFTEAYDRGEKFERYRQLESLKEYVLISQACPLIETFFRQEGGSWLFHAWSGLEASALLRCVEIEIPLREVYDQIVFPPAQTPVEEPAP